MRFKETTNYTKGLITAFEDHSIPDGSASASTNWQTRGDRIELRKGYKVLGTEQTGTGSIDGLHVAQKADGTQVAFRKRGRKLEYYLNDDFSTLDQEQTDWGENYWGDTTFERLAQSFQPTVTAQISKVKMVVWKMGSPVDSIKLELYTNSGSAPGALVVAAQATILGSTLDADEFLGNYVEFTFAEGTTLTANTTYWLVLTRTGAQSGSNYYGAGITTNSSYTRGNASYYYSAAWHADATDALYFQQYYYENRSDWVEVGTNLFPAAAETDEAAFANYASLAGNQMFISSPNSGMYKIMVANPGSYTTLTDTSKNYKGYIKIKQNRMFLWGRNEDKTGIYGSYIDAAAYTTVTAESIGTGDGSDATFSGTLAFKAGGAVRTCFGVTIKVDGAVTLTDDYNGNLKDSSGTVRGSINYTSGAYDITFGTAPGNTLAIVADYQWENSNNTGITDFSKSAPRTAGQGFIFRQDDGGGSTMNVSSYGDTEFCLHRLKSWALTLTADDTNATNLIYRDNVGIPNWRGSISTGDGIYFVDDYNQSDPKFRLLTINNISTAVIPLPVSDQLKLEDYRFDKAATIEWGDYVLFACRHKDSASNNTVFGYNKRYKAWDKFDYYVSCFEIYNGALIAGDSVSDNVFELFSGFDDNGSIIGNSWEGNLTDHGINTLKKTRKFWIQGEISKDQTLKFYLKTDRGSYVLIGTQNGTDTNVDTSPRTIIGSDAIGQSTIGGQSSTNVYNYTKEIRLQNGRYQYVKLKVEATSIGFASVSTYTFLDIIENQSKLPTKYRSN
jgi:hypothetical protein